MEIRDFKFLFDKDGKVAKGKKVMFYPYADCFREPMIVELAGYWPYYTNGWPDPKIDEVDETCFIEIESEYVDEKQIQLCEIFELKEVSEDEKEFLYDCDYWECLGKFKSYVAEWYVGRQKGTEKSISLFEEHEMQKEKELSELDESELLSFYNSCLHGSMYLHDYCNDVCIEINKASNICDLWLDYLDEEEKESTFEEFKHWVALGCYE